MSKTATTAKKAVKTAKTVAKNTGENMVKNPKTVLYVVLGATAIFLGYKMYKTINGVFDAPELDDHVSGTGGTTSKATITTQQAKNYAQQLLDAMNEGRNSWFSGGTDEDTIEAVFDQLKNGDDFNLVYAAFGTKDYNGYNSPVEGTIGNLLDSYEAKNLVYWLKSELSSTFENALYNKVKARVESAGFTF